MAGSASRRPSLLPLVLPTLRKKEKPRAWLSRRAVRGGAVSEPHSWGLNGPISPPLLPPALPWYPTPRWAQSPDSL